MPRVGDLEGTSLEIGGDLIVGRNGSLYNIVATSTSNNIVANALFSNAGAVTVSTLAAAAPVVGNILTINAAGASSTAIWQAPTTPAAYGAMFYGLTTGTGNGGATDYAATIAVKTTAGTGRVPFPRNGPIYGTSPMSIANGTTSPALLAEINIPTIGTYRVTFNVHTTEPGQLQLELQGVDLPATVASNLNSTVAGHNIIGDSIITTTVINSKLAVVNCVGNVAVLTITPADGNRTAALAQTITIMRVN